MGMAASQARFLGLTARKSNTEYEGQQVNQQRTALANQSAGLFNQMLALEVPTPPSATNYYNLRYTYKDGKECENSASMTLTVQYVPEPVLTGHTSIVTENSAPQLSAQVLDGAEV